MNITARKIRQGAKTVVVVTHGDGKTQTFGGKRAERAQAALVVAVAENDVPSAWGVRGNLVNAQKEADRMMRAALNPVHLAVAVPVKDDTAGS